MNERSVAITLVIPILIFVHVAEGQTKKLPRIGWLSVRPGPTIHASFIQGLRDLGWFVGRNIAIEARFAKERYDQLPKLAAELVHLKVDVIVAGDSSAIPAAKNATHRIPIVMAIVRDPVSLGYVASLARPGGNITGVSNDLGPIRGKRLQILKEAVPIVSRVAMLGPTGHVDWIQLETTSRSLGMEPLALRFHDPDQFESLFNTAKTQRTNGLMVFPGPQTNMHRKKIIMFASQHRLPAIYPRTTDVVDGGLMSYGPNLSGRFRRAAEYVDKILKGAKPSDLPIERPMTAEFAINLKTAGAIRVEIPPEVLQRADYVFK